MRRSDRRAIVFICAVVLAFWGGVLLERWLSSRADRGLTLDKAAMNSLDSMTATNTAQPRPVGTSSEEGHTAQPLPSGTSNEEGHTAQPLPSLTGGAGGGSAGGGSSGSSGSSASSPFDPNTADSATLVAAGLEPWQARNILKYRARGGRYRRAEDLKRVYGMTPEQYEHMAPYVRIDKRFQPYDENEFEGERARREAARQERERLYEERLLERQAREQARHDSLAKRYPRQEKFEELVQLNLNTVDTTTLKKVPGIASYRARQIVRYRERLGGFVSTAQLAEIEGFPANELEAWFKVEGGVRRINVNKASVQEMGRHPYIGFARARAIESYRRNQGRIKSIDDLCLLEDFTQEARDRMREYVEY